MVALFNRRALGGMRVACVTNYGLAVVTETFCEAPLSQSLLQGICSVCSTMA